MPDQQINPDGDIIKNVQEDSHVKGACVPAWAQPTLLIFTDGAAIQFSDGAVLSFAEY